VKITPNAKFKKKNGLINLLNKSFPNNSEPKTSKREDITPNIG
jgi:hypothetical protein